MYPRGELWFVIGVSSLSETPPQKNETTSRGRPIQMSATAADYLHFQDNLCLSSLICEIETTN